MALALDSEYIISIIAYLSPYIKLVYSVSAANYKCGSYIELMFGFSLSVLPSCMTDVIAVYFPFFT